MRKLMSILVISFLFIGIVFASGCINEIEKKLDPCKARFEECNYACGEGWLSGLCKAECTERYQDCKRQ